MDDWTCLVLLDESPQSLLVVRQAAMETQTLLGFGQPLQQDVDAGMEFLGLGGITYTHTHRDNDGVRLREYWMCGVLNHRA